MNLGPEIVSGSYKYLLVQSGSNPITLGANASVNWNAGGVVATTGAQNISGIKTFFSNVKAVSFGNGSGVSNAFGLSASDNDFGSNAAVNYFGNNATSLNQFGDSSAQNYFGYLASNNSFGEGNSYNAFGYEGTQNQFGYNSDSNDFGSTSDNNAFGSYSISNTFGLSATNNSFGSDNLNTYLGTCLFTSTGRMRLANFTGAASQTGLRGEARVSGTFLYVCTGSTSGWGRVQLITF
jgi:hypothetical protein